MAAQTLEVILTHEHTDFDALASLLAASLLYPKAIPVLPRQMNRNVREFVSLYHGHLPFVAAKELPRSRISRVVLVDTRALNLPRGLAPGAEVIVIDHHTEAANEPGAGQAPKQVAQRVQPSTWTVWSEAVGANATLLIERLMETQSSMRPLHATLLALGIHEDTGSLTYGGTTWRDARALAWLLEPERGVDLDTVNQFLHHPLGEGQRTLLEALIASSEIVEVEGHTVVIAQGAAHGRMDEISTVAARLRDFHEQDAVFLVIQLEEMVQIVARSVTDEIDVGDVARALGGGGHTRAAAAPVRGRTTAQLRDEIVRLLREQTRARSTVRDIMSAGRPRTLSPDISISEAAEQMRRYGHEGFPVVVPGPQPGEETLAGVLTRREADRAILHGLGNEPVRRFMQAGSVSVQPGDSLPLLRKTMIDSGWGQVPVVDARGRMVGIVTRTDLIKMWDEKRGLQSRTAGIERQLTTALRPLQQHMLRLLGEEAAGLGFTVYVVGGFVRDLLLRQAAGRIRNFDMDIVLEGDGILFATHLANRFGGRVVQHRQFGTAKWILDDPDAPVDIKRLLSPLSVETLNAEIGEHIPPHFDFISARTEFYTAPTVLPTVETSSIKLDLHRRDFTINTLALCLNPERWGQLLDFWGGTNDLQTGIVRVLHSLSFVDDPTRILRAVRYEQRFNFRIDPRTLELIDDALNLLERVTPARIRHELERILQEAEPEQILTRLEALGVLTAIAPSLAAGEWVQTHFPRLRAAWEHMEGATATFLANLPNAWADGLVKDLHNQPLERLYWAVLVYPSPAGEDAAVTSRLGLRRATQVLVEDMRHLQAHAAELRAEALRPSRAVEILDDVDAAAAALFVLLEEDARVAEIVHRYRSEWRQIHAALRGEDLQRLGLPPGPRYRDLLARLRAARIDGQAHTRADEEALVRAWLAS